MAFIVLDGLEQFVRRSPIYAAPINDVSEMSFAVERLHHLTTSERY